MGYLRDKALEYTGVQEIVPYRDSINHQYDFVMIYGIDATTPRRIAEWREKGYVVHLMTGVAWGTYQDYLKGKFDGREHWDESQTMRDGNPVLHGFETPYMVPTVSFSDYMTEQLKTAIDAGVLAIHLEEPEYWSFGGYAEAFKREYELYYRKKWEPFHKDVNSVYSGSKLMAYLYTRMVDRVCSALREYALIKYHRVVRFYIPTHSLLSYCQIRMVSPESKFINTPAIDGYIAQIWTGTSRNANEYEGVLRERTFESGFFEYGIMQELVKGTDRRMWFLHDPVEDNASHTWEDYEYNYIKTLCASLYQPHIHHYEVAPWPHRVFDGVYPRGNDIPEEAAKPIPPHYITVLANIFNMLGDMDQPVARVNDLDYNVGILMADSCMYQRQVPDTCAGKNDPDGINERANRPDLPDFMGIALPLLKHGLPVRPVQLDNANRIPGYLNDYQILLLTYEYFKPDSPALNAALANWVSEGGVLCYFGDGSDPFHQVSEWWNQNGEYENAAQHLFVQLGLGKQPADGIYTFGKGCVSVSNCRPARLCASKKGAELVRSTVEKAMLKKGYCWQHTNTLLLRRGCYLVISCMDESVSDKPYTEKGLFVDMTKAELPVVRLAKVAPNENKVYFDLSTIRDETLRIIVTSVRFFTLQSDESGFSAECEGAEPLEAVIRLRLPKAPKSVSISCPGGTVPCTCEWEDESSTALIRFTNNAKRLKIEGAF